MTRAVPLTCLTLVVACATAEAPDFSADADPSSPDAAVASPDASTQPTPDAAPDAPDAPPLPTGGHLLLSEIVLAPTEGEFVEIYNPTATAVDLTNYYLADTQAYFELPAGVPTVAASDFIARFPAGASIAAGGVATIAVPTAADFAATYASAPTFSLGAGGQAMLSIAGGAAPTLTNAGEAVVLFRWDGASDLVSDVDLMNAGTPSAGNAVLAKTGVAVDGPDADAAASSYATDALTLGSQAAAPNSGESTQRIAREAGNETQGAGNGITGDDETSENIASTWDTTPFGVPTPGSIPSTLGP